VALASLLTGPAALAEVFGPEDVCGWSNVADPAIAPDGSGVAFVLRSCDLATDERSADLWYVGTLGAEPRQLTTWSGADHSPRWSPDGAALAFVSTRSGEPQIWRFDGLDGEPRQVTSQAGGASDPVWTPDGATLLYTSRGPTVARDPLQGEDVRVHRDLLYRKGSHQSDGRFRHLYRVDATGGDGTRLTSEDRDHGEATVSPDGRLVALVRSPAHEGVFSIDTDVVVVPIDGGEPRPVTRNQGPDHGPAWSPDGRWLLTRSILEPGYESGRRRVMLWPTDGGEPTELTAGLDRNVFRASFAPDGRSVEVLLDGPGTWHLARLPLDRPGEAVPLTGGRSWLWGFDRAAEGSAVLLATDPTHPAELWLLPSEAPTPAQVSWTSEGTARRLTGFGDALTSSRALSHPEPREARTDDGRPVPYYYFPPARAEGRRPPPLVLFLHGGPQWTVGEYWDPEIQMLASAGYAVVAPNFTGSTGYGQAWTDAIAGDWGGAPLEDSLAAVDDALAAGLGDPDRLAVSGGSYGGFLAAWAITRTDRFSAAVVARAVVDPASYYGTTDEQFFLEKDLGGTPWSNPDGYARWSPLRVADRIRTPTLIIHSDEDHRVPVEQAEQLFTALVRLGVPAELVRFPGEGHGMRHRGTPVHRRERQRHVLRWLGTYLQ